MLQRLWIGGAFLYASYSTIFLPLAEQQGILSLWFPVGWQLRTPPRAYGALKLYPHPPPLLMKETLTPTGPSSVILRRRRLDNPINSSRGRPHTFHPLRPTGAVPTRRINLCDMLQRLRTLQSICAEPQSLSARTSATPLPFHCSDLHHTSQPRIFCSPETVLLPVRNQTTTNREPTMPVNTSVRTITYP
ncbi:hypothetical protein BDV93DRAFT_267799 [Ceratobasidium sp. AG-I]|nr:hypothetical protein BDV93DRAFT_267799 [Ceratobasidium sp. AG-I]